MAVPQDGQEPRSRYTPDDPQYWIEKCARGDGHTCSMVGGNYEKGGQTPWGYFPQNDASAAASYRQGCDFGDPRGCGGLGQLMLKGRGIAKDERAGAELVVSACQRGDQWACFDAGYVLLTGTGLAFDREAGLSLLNKGCVSGNLGACSLKRSVEGSGAYSTLEPPAGAAGFPFGISMRDAEQRCRLAGHTWKADTLGYCDGSATPNMPFEVLMDPCNGKICSVMLVERMTQASATAWLLRFRQLESDLAKRYGDPGQRILKIPTDCTTRIVPLISAPPGSPEQNSATVLTDAKGDDIFVRCMAAKRLDIRTIWGWETKHSVALYLQQLNSMGPSIVVNYMTPEASRSNRATGL